MIKEDLFYTSKHEWARWENDTVTVGITDYAQEQLDDVTFVETPSPDTDVEKEQEIGVIESVKAASDVYSPVSGHVSEVNPKLESQPELINSDPYGEGWICRLTGVSKAGQEGLLTADQYRELTGD